MPLSTSDKLFRDRWVVNGTGGTALRGAPKLFGAVSPEEIHREKGRGTDTQYKSQNPTTALISTLVHCTGRNLTHRRAGWRSESGGVGKI